MTPGSGQGTIVPKVSVIIVNWNGRRHLEHCLPALSAQSRPPDQIIVVDNGSDDGSVEWLQRHHPELDVVALHENLGFTGGNLRGLAESESEYVVLLNNDTMPLPQWLESLVECAERRPEVGIVASHMTDWEGRLTDTAGDGCSVSGRGYKQRRNQPASNRLESEYIFSACAGAALYKREMLDDVGFFDARFFMNGEDTDLSFRAQLRGWQAYLCAGAVVRHRIGASQGVDSNTSVFFGARNHFMTLWKCMPARLIIVYLPFLAAETVKLWLYFALRGRGRAYACGVLAGLKAFPGLLEERARVRAGRRVTVAELERKLSWPRALAGLRPGVRRQRVAREKGAA